MYNAHNWSLVDKATAEGDDDDDVPPPDDYEIEKKFEMVSTFPLPSLSLSLSLSLNESTLLKGRCAGTQEVLPIDLTKAFGSL